MGPVLVNVTDTLDS